MSVRTVTPSSDLPPPAVKGRLNQLTDLEAELAALADMSLTELRKRWQSVTDKPVPRVRRTLLHLALAFELQAALHGGLSRRAELRLAYLAGKGTADQAAVPGMRLVREWNGQLAADCRAMIAAGHTPLPHETAACRRCSLADACNPGRLEKPPAVHRWLLRQLGSPAET